MAFCNRLLSSLRLELPPLRNSRSLVRHSAVRFVSLNGLTIYLCPLLLLLLTIPAAAAEWSPPKPGFVVHFDFLSSAGEGRTLVKIAARAGAKVINVVPPAHIWDNPPSLEILEAILDEIDRNHLSLIFTRIDAAYPPDAEGNRYYYLYSRILTEPGILPNGRPTRSYFKTTAGRDGYEEWMEEETRYYASHYGKRPNLIGINLGAFSEAFSSERAGFLEYMKETESYEITQYTRYALKLWHRWLRSRFPDAARMNREYESSFRSPDAVPMPLNEKDTRFGRADLAYFDFARSINDWYFDCYDRCRKIWHQVSGRTDVPFILQLSGGEAEKIALGRPSFAAFDMPGWIAAADAAGLSLYTNSGFPDMGHGSIQATVDLVALARNLGRDVFVLEGGNEAPNVTLDPVEFRFFGNVARRLSPRTYIYEFLKEKFAEEYPHNPGKIVAANGRIRRPAFNAMSAMFREIESTPPVAVKPVLYAVSDPFAARGNERAGQINSAVYYLAFTLQIEWIPAGTKPRLEPGVPVLQPDGTVVPPDEKLSALFRNIPPVDSPARAGWRSAVAALLAR